MITDLRSGRCRLRTSRLSDLDALLAADVAIIDEAELDQRRTTLRRRIEKDPQLITDGFTSLTIEVDAEVVGDVQARAPRYAFPPGVCELGISLAPQHRGRGVGQLAVPVFTDLLLADWARVQAITAVNNVAMRRVLEKSGYRFEGMWRDFLPDPTGGRADGAGYARVRG